MLLAFALWIFCFWGFLSDKLSLVSDAISYHDHFQYFIQNISQGVYPMWDYIENRGAPTEFFMRRIGSFNPLFWLILLLDKAGLSFNHAYLSFLALYYLLGIAGYYLIVKRILKDELIAFLACLLLMFSSLGTRPFDSFLLFSFVPLVWFFYFLIVFCQEFTKHAFIGIIFTLMILFATYLPFYFLSTIFIFLIWYGIFYFKNFRPAWRGFVSFVSGHKLLSSFCLLALIISLLPSLLFFREILRGEIVFPERHYYGSSSNMLEVGYKTVTDWGMEEDIAYSGAYSNLTKFHFAIFYAPLFTYVVFLCGLITAVHKRLIFLFCWGISIFVLFSSNTPVFEFLYQHLFYFKYFRNLHFFLWLVLLPLVIFILADQMQSFLKFSPESRERRISLFFFLVLAHAGILYYIYDQKQGIATSYAVTLLSFILFLLYFYGGLKRKNLVFVLLILSVVVIQPVEVYHYLQKNSERKGQPYTFDHPYSMVRLGESIEILEKSKIASKDDREAHTLKMQEPRVYSTYYATKWSYFFNKKISEGVLGSYFMSSFLVYDRVKIIDNNENIDLKEIEDSLIGYKNLAFVAKGEGEKDLSLSNQVENINAEATYIAEDSQELKVLKVNANGVKVKTDFDFPRFLVFNDSYHSRWKVFVNGQEAKLWRANIAFKGLWVPAGENIVYFRFGENGQYVLNLCFFIIFNLMGAILLYFSFKDLKSALTKAA